jgi:hypothetical protein
LELTGIYRLFYPVDMLYTVEKHLREGSEMPLLSITAPWERVATRKLETVR